MRSSKFEVRSTKFPERRLRTFLASADRPAGTLSYQELQGFLFTVASAPELILPTDWLPIVFADQDAGFVDMAETNAILGQITTLYNGICGSIIEARPALPPGCVFRRDILANLDSAAPIAGWARGFLMGHQWLEDLWDVDFPDDIGDEFGAALMALSFFASPDLAEAFRRECPAPQPSLEDMARSMRGVFPEAISAYTLLGRRLAAVNADVARSTTRQ